ncbi:MAG: CRISPR-associated protein Cas4, partial [Acidimicrobiia bacterium]
MVNEFAYCPRLFFLEWVQAQFADNLDTVEGRWNHRAVDEPAGAVPLPGDGEVRVARSVLLSSKRLGLVTKIDLLEGDGASVLPVDTKRGSPPEIPERAWEPERVQLCVQGLLLREHGYHCDQGILYFAGSRERVPVVFDEALVARTHELVIGLRELAASAVPRLPWWQPKVPALFARRHLFARRGQPVGQPQRAAAPAPRSPANRGPPGIRHRAGG